MCGAVLFVDMNKDARQSLNNNRVFDGTCIPTGEPGGFDESERLGAGVFAGAGDEHITLDVLISQQ